MAVLMGRRRRCYVSEIVEILIFLGHRGDNALKSKTGKYEKGALGGAWWVWQNASHLPTAWLRNT